MRSRITGVQAQMSNFSFHWGIILGELLLRHADNLSKTFQNPKLSTASGQEISSKTVETLQHIRNERDFNLFYDMVLKHKKHLGDRVAQPKLPRKRNAPRRFQIGATSPEHPASAKDQHRMEYFLALDYLINSITQRFQQKGYEMYRNLQDVIVKACNGENFVKELPIICDFHGSDLSKPDLEVQLQTLSVRFKSQISVTLDDIHKYMLTIKCNQRPFYSEVIADFGNACHKCK